MDEHDVIRRLYEALENAYNAHGGCGCKQCEATEMTLFDIRNRYGFTDGLKRDHLVAIYGTAKITACA